MRSFLKNAILYFVLLVWLLAVVMPLLWVFASSLRSSREFVEDPFGMPWLITGSPYAENPDVDTPWESVVAGYRKAWVKSKFSRFFLNSVLVTTLSLAGIIGLSSMASYVLAKFAFPGSKLVLLYFVSGLMIPAQLVLIPLFFQFTTLSRWGTALLAPFGYELQLHDTFTGLITIYVALSLPFTILVLAGFFKSLPGELREAGIMDGCTEYGVFLHIMLPLSKPGLVTAAIFNFLGIWNEYLFALVFMNSDSHKTLPLGLAAVSIQAQYRTDFGLMFAGLVIVLVPTLLVYIVLQKQLTRGITVGALKG
ncbi:MAG: carbohydrate ABC transporter permease [Candidatus Hydrogenedentes bacterium]|nr:carbohydrate ABC transporter permease [Candidatus Hydrogenedentota bacterium]